MLFSVQGEKLLELLALLSKETTIPSVRWVRGTAGTVIIACCGIHITKD